MVSEEGFPTLHSFKIFTNAERQHDWGLLCSNWLHTRICLPVDGLEVNKLLGDVDPTSRFKSELCTTVVRAAGRELKEIAASNDLEEM